MCIFYWEIKTSKLSNNSWCHAPMPGVDISRQRVNVKAFAFLDILKREKRSFDHFLSLEWPVHFALSPEAWSEQCDHNGRIWKVHDNKFANKSSPKRLATFGIIWKDQLMLKLLWILFRRLFKQLGNFFAPTSGYTGLPSCLSIKTAKMLKQVQSMKIPSQNAGRLRTELCEKVWSSIAALNMYEASNDVYSKT